MRRLLGVGLILGLSTGCLFMSMKNATLPEEKLGKYWYTYAGEDPYGDPSSGLVLGQARLAVDLYAPGATLNLQREEGGVWRDVQLELDYHWSVYRGILIGRTWSTLHKDVVNVWTGEVPPMGRRDGLRHFQTANQLLSLYGGNSDFWRNVRALTLWTHDGWFLLKVPPGRYRMANLYWERSETDWDERVGYTVITTTTISNSRSVAASFDVAPGQVNFIGQYVYPGERGDPRYTRVPEEAAAALAQIVRRLSEASAPWPVVDVEPVAF